MSISVKEYQALNKPKKAGRYGRNKRVVSDGQTFDSQGEFDRWSALQGFLKRGEIAELERQVDFPFEHNGVLICTYRADFTYVVAETLVVEDYKGKIITPEFRIKRKMMQAFYGIEIRIVASARADIR